jgi:hypothetical protein
MAVACAVGLTAGGLLTAGSGAVANAAPAWTVTVGAASHPLDPGSEATMSYSVRNATDGVQRLHGTTTQLTTDGAGDACLGRWFRVASNSLPSDVDVPPGGVVNGSLVLAFDDPPVAQDTCRNVDIDVVVTAS